MMRYPPLTDYALISDCYCNALVSRYGSVDWSCMPRMDDDSSFGRLLDWDHGGYCSIAPADPEYVSAWRYIDGSMILETDFKTDQGEVRLTDFFVIDRNGTQAQRHYDHIRLVNGLAGEVKLQVEISPRFDYGEIVPYVQQHKEGLFTAIGSNQGLVIHSDFALDVVEHRDIVGTIRLRAGERARLGIRFAFPETVEQELQRGLPCAEDVDGYYESTRDWWAGWSAQMQAPFPLDAQTIRSTIVLKALTFEPTGAIIAASTTSLPEWIGGSRNWDYRFSWVRDSVFTIRALHELGYVSEASRYHGFIQRSAAGDAQQLQIMYGIDGKRRLTESELDWMEGYRGSRPVRLGNAAAKQTQLDIYGELLEMAWLWHQSGHPTEPEYWNFLVDVVDHVCHVWDGKDQGIWEVRGEPQHYVHSKAMCWAALNRGIELAKVNGFDVPLQAWIDNRAAVREAIETRGYDKERGVFVQTFDGNDLDAALLILPRIGFIDYDDPRMLRTVDALCKDLDENGLLLRYRGPDGLEGPEGVFLPCTFWLVECLAHQDRMEQAWKYYRQTLACGNELGLFSEEFDMKSQQMLGNFPQGLTHVSQIMAWLALQKVETAQGRGPDEPSEG